MKLHIVTGKNKNIALCGINAVLFSKSEKDLYIDFPQVKIHRYCKNCIKKSKIKL